MSPDFISSNALRGMHHFQSTVIGRVSRVRDLSSSNAFGMMTLAVRAMHLLYLYRFGCNSDGWCNWVRSLGSGSGLCNCGLGVLLFRQGNCQRGVQASLSTSRPVAADVVMLVAAVAVVWLQLLRWQQVICAAAACITAGSHQRGAVEQVSRRQGCGWESRVQSHPCV